MLIYTRYDPKHYENVAGNLDLKYILSCGRLFDILGDI